MIRNQSEPFFRLKCFIPVESGSAPGVHREPDSIRSRDVASAKSTHPSPRPDSAVHEDLIAVGEFLLLTCGELEGPSELAARVDAGDAFGAQ